MDSCNRYDSCFDNICCDYNRLVAYGYLYFYPYFVRKTILRNVVDVDIGYRSAMAVDKNGILWGWGSFPYTVRYNLAVQTKTLTEVRN